MEFTFTGELWLWPGDSGWHFVSLPAAVTDEIDARLEGGRRGFGSVKVRVRTGDTSWETSIFPDSKSRTYVLPVKKRVRSQEALTVGDFIDIHLTVIGS